jgi:hypothetical protein
LTLIAGVVDEATGRPVANLTAEDFTVTVAGVPVAVRIADYVKVTGTDGIAAGATSPTPSTPAPQEPTPRQLLFLLDDVSMTSEDVVELRNTLPRATGHFEASDRIGLMTTSGLPAAIAPTAEREPVIAALGQVDGRLFDERGALYIGLDEAIEIARGFPLDTLTRVVARECSGRSSIFESGMKSNDVPLGVTVQPRRHPSGQVEVVVAISATPETFPATVIFGLIDHRGEFVTAGQRQVPSAGADGIRLVFSLTVFPGQYRLRVAVGESGDAGQYGLAEFAVNATIDSPLGVGGLPRPLGGW